MIPLDTPFPVKDSLMDFTVLRSLTPSILEVNGGGMPGIDHAFVLLSNQKEENENSRKKEEGRQDHSKRLRRVATLQDDESGRRIEIATTECALIVYTSNWVNEQPPFVPVREMR